MADILKDRKFSAHGGSAIRLSLSAVSSRPNCSPSKSSGWKCAFCGGSGVQPRSLRSRCLACRGKGAVEFENPVKCPSCRGRGSALTSSTLSCLRCRGIGAVEKNEGGGEAAADIIRERLGEITKRLGWTRKEAEKKTKEIKKRLKPIKPFVKEIKQETQWLEILGNKIKRGWQSLWED